MTSPALSLLDVPTPVDLTNVAILAGAFAVGLIIILSLFRSYLFICRPNEVLVVSGRKTVLASGEKLNFSVIQAGRHWRTPFIQTVNRVDVRLIPIELQVTKVLSNGGIPLDVHAIANVKITSDPQYIHNAIERFLNLPPESIKLSAKQMLEGVLRGVISQLTPEQVNEDRIEFANKLLEITSEDFNKMGLHLDTLKVQRVEDEAQYLVNIARTQIANALRDAENAENQASQEVAQEEAGARQLAEVAQKQGQIGVSQRRNQFRAVVGQLEGQAQSVEREAKVAAEQARAEAEQELQTLRKQLETKRLYAEVVLPAEAQKQASALIAEGTAAPRRAQGEAAALVMKMMADALKSAGPQAREIFVLSQIDQMVGAVAQRVKAMQVSSVSIVDGGDGEALSALVSSFPQAVASVLGTLTELTGVDVRQLMGGAS